MNEFHFNLRMCSMSSYQINEEWSLECSWRLYKKSKVKPPTEGGPEYLNISRKSTTDDILISGTYELFLGEVSLVEKKFLQLIEAGCSTTQINLAYMACCYHNESLSINGTLKVLSGVVLTEEPKVETLLELSSNFERLFVTEEPLFSDVSFKCGKESFSVHKIILSARSPVFAAMFKTEMIESRENKVEITDISPQNFRTMLTYIYTGKTGELSVQSVEELLFAADKYQLLDLKRICRDYLRSCLSTEHALKTLVLGYLHDEDLKVFAMDFISNSYEDFAVLEETAEWKNLRENYSSLTIDVLTYVVKSQQEKLRRCK